MRILPGCLLAILLAAPAFADRGRDIVKDDTNVTTYIRIVDSGDGTPETGVVYNTASLDLEYVRCGAAAVDITEATLAAAGSAHSDGGFIHVGHGIYRVDLPDAACIAGADDVSVQGTVTGMVVLGVTHQLSGVDPYDATDFGVTVLSDAPTFDEHYNGSELEADVAALQTTLNAGGGTW